MSTGGTGITPMLQLARDITKNRETDSTKIALLFANQTEDDILLREELDDLAQQHPDRFKVWYTLDNVTDGKDFVLLSFTQIFIIVDFYRLEI